jgi:hypothetical protein
MCLCQCCDLTQADIRMPRAGDCRFSARLPSPCVRDIPGDSLWLLYIDMHIAMAPRPQVIVGTCIWAATYAHRNILLVYRNFSVSKPSTRIQVESVHNSLQVKVRLPRPWKVRPGQYVYLTMMRPRFFSILQRHPFMVAGSEAQDHDFQLCIQPRVDFTSRLLTRTLGGTREFSAFVEGPYGHGFDLQNFGTVVLFASGIGIVGHLGYIQKLVLDYRQSKTKTRDLLVVWHVDNKYQLDLVWEVMNNVLRRDDLPATAMRRDARAPYGSGKMDRYLGSSSRNTSESPGLRPAPHRENASVAAWRPNVTKR